MEVSTPRPPPPSCDWPTPVSATAACRAKRCSPHRFSHPGALSSTPPSRKSSSHRPQQPPHPRVRRRRRLARSALRPLPVVEPPMPLPTSRLRRALEACYPLAALPRSKCRLHRRRSARHRSPRLAEVCCADSNCWPQLRQSPFHEPPSPSPQPKKRRSEPPRPPFSLETTIFKPPSPSQQHPQAPSKPPSPHDPSSRRPSYHRLTTKNYACFHRATSKPHKKSAQPPKRRSNRS